MGADVPRWGVLLVCAGAETQVFNRWRWRVSTVVATARLRQAGATLGSGVEFRGLPIMVGRLERISLGARALLISDPRGTALGVRCATILRIMGPEGRIAIGEDTGISGVAICSAAAVQIGARCLIGADVKIFDTDFHAQQPEGRRYGAPDWPAISQAVVIEDDVFIGANAMVCKGARIGRGSVIGAGSVVTGVIPPMSVAAGVPARVIRRLEAA